MITYIGTNGRYHDGNGVDYGLLLAEEFPAREQLITAGLAYTEQVRKATDEALLAIDGVGKTTLTKIREALATI
jgi:hypothetical protein